MKVKFVAPHSPTSLDVDVDEDLTGTQAIGELVACRFVPPATDRREYALVNMRSQDLLLPDRPLGKSGVRDGDVIEVVQATEGASW